MTELTFLVELLLNHKIPKATKDLVAARIKEVEEGLARPAPVYAAPLPLPPIQATNGFLAAQAPSTQAALARHPDLIPAPVPVAIVAQTPATMAAMASREQAINESLQGKVDKTTGRPRKF